MVNLKKKYLPLIILASLLLIPNALASITIPTNVYFLVDGVWRNFSAEHTFSTVERISGIWYFDGHTFNEVEGHIYIPPIPRNQVITMFNVALLILGLIIVVFMAAMILNAFRVNGNFDLIVFIVFMGFIFVILLTVVIVNLVFVSLL